MTDTRDPISTPRRWQDLTTEELAALDRGRLIAVLPVAAIEQHGPHLPLSVDAVIAEGIVARAGPDLPPDVPVAVLPLLPVGKSNEHAAFPGTLSLSTETVLRLWRDVAESVARAGVGKLVIFNSHGGQSGLVELVARDLRVERRMTVLAFNAYRFLDAGDLFDEAEIRHGVHGGAVETSMMLHLAPHLVRAGRIADFVPSTRALSERLPALHPGGRPIYAWETRDLHPSGAVGDATAADAEKGRILVERAARAFVEVIAALDRMPAGPAAGGTGRNRT